MALLAARRVTGSPAGAARSAGAAGLAIGFFWRCTAGPAAFRSFGRRAAGEATLRHFRRLVGIAVCILKGFESRIGEKPKFKFNIEMVADGSRYHVVCQGDAKQENSAYEMILTMLELRNDE